jgi:hypothetical protein
LTSPVRAAGQEVFDLPSEPQSGEIWRADLGLAGRTPPDATLLVVLFHRLVPNGLAHIVRSN